MVKCILWAFLAVDNPFHGYLELSDLVFRQLAKLLVAAPLRQVALVLQHEANKQRCPAVGHIDDAAHRSQTAVVDVDKVQLLAQVLSHGLGQCSIQILGQWRCIEEAVEMDGLVLDDKIAGLVSIKTPANVGHHRL